MLMVIMSTLLKKQIYKHKKLTLIVIACLVVALLGWRASDYLTWHTNYSPKFSCGDGTVSQANINSFVDAYKKGQTSSVKVLAVYGTSAMEFYATCHNLVTRHGVIYNSEFSYADAAPPEPVAYSTCALIINQTKTPIANCGPKDTFALQSQ
jgi:hypothetical protein